MSAEEEKKNDAATVADVIAEKIAKIELSPEGEKNDANDNDNDNAEKKTKMFLRSADGKVFEVEEDVVMECSTVKSFFQEDDVLRDRVMPIPNVQSSELEKILDFCKKSLELRRKVAAAVTERGRKKAEKELRIFYQDMVKDESTKQVFELFIAADFLNVNELQAVLCLRVADRIKNKSIGYARTLFGIKNDYTPEEEAKIKEVYAWAFDGVEEDDGEDSIEKLNI